MVIPQKPTIPTAKKEKNQLGKRKKKKKKLIVAITRPIKKGPNCPATPPPKKSLLPPEKKITSQFFAPSKTSGSKKKISNHAKILKNLKRMEFVVFAALPIKN